MKAKIHEVELYDEILIQNVDGEYQLIRICREFRSGISEHEIIDADLESALEANSFLASVNKRSSVEEHFQKVQTIVEFWLCSGTEEEKQAELASFDLSIDGLERFLILMNLDHLIHLMDMMSLVHSIKTIDDMMNLIVKHDKEARALELIYLRLGYVKDTYIKNPFTIDPIGHSVSSKISKIEVLEKTVFEKITAQR